MTKEEKQEIQEYGFNFALGACQALGLITGVFVALGLVTTAVVLYWLS